MAPVILNNVRKVYGGTVEAVRGVSFDIDDGSFCVLVGPSGCGKSTLLRMIAGLEMITDGDIRIGERVVNEIEPADRDIAMVVQNYALYPHMNVYDNMAYGLRNRRTPKPEIDARVREAAVILGIEPLLTRRPRELSGGQRQRVAMGRAIVRKPQVFLFDEPLSNLDAKLRVQMRVEIKRLQRALGVTSVYVTHDQVEAMTLSDKLVVMNGGVIDQVGTPTDVYRRPASSPSSRSWRASRASFRAASASASPWAAPSSASPRSSSSMSRSPTSTPSCACRCGSRSAGSSARSGSRRSTSRTTRSKQ